jgi:hypothetical protein
MKAVAFITEYAVLDRIIDHMKLTFVADKPPPSHVFAEVALTAAEGARIRVTGPLYFNPQMAYYSGFSSASFQAGFGLILF